MKASADLPVDRAPVHGRFLSAARRLLVTTAGAVADDVDEVACEIADVILRSVDEIQTDPATRLDTEARAREGILAFCDLVARDASPESFAVPPSAYEFARILARRGVPVSVLLRVHRLGLATILDAFENRLERTPSDAHLLDTARLITEIAFASHDVLTSEVCREYERERDEWTRGARAIRRETVESILAGEPIDPDQASRALGHELRRHHVGLVVWSASDSEDEGCTVTALQEAAARVAEELGGGRPLLLEHSPRVVWAWIGTDRAVEQDAVEQLSHICFPGGVRVAVGDCSHGLAGFRRTHQEAADTAHVAALAGRRPGSLTSYHAVELAAFMSDDVVRTRRFVQHQLGPLARDEDEQSRLRVTLMLYLEEHGSRIATARRLGIHPNTVANRIRTCREMLDRDLSHRQVHLQVALSLAATLGTAVLSPGHKRS